MAVSSTRGRVEQSRRVLELAPTAATSPECENATDLTTWREKEVVHSLFQNISSTMELTCGSVTVANRVAVGH